MATNSVGRLAQREAPVALGGPGPAAGLTGQVLGMVGRWILLAAIAMGVVGLTALAQWASG